MPVGWGRGNGVLLSHGDRVSIWEDEKVLELGGGGGHTVMRMSLVPLYTKTWLGREILCNVYLPQKYS